MGLGGRPRPRPRAEHLFERLRAWGIGRAVAYAQGHGQVIHL